MCPDSFLKGWSRKNAVLGCVLLLVFKAPSEFATGVCIGVAWSAGELQEFSWVASRWSLQLHRSSSSEPVSAFKERWELHENRQTLFDVATGGPPSGN